MINYNLFRMFTVTLVVAVMTIVGISYVPFYVTAIDCLIYMINVVSIYIHVSNHGFGIELPFPFKVS